MNEQSHFSCFTIANFHKLSYYLDAFSLVLIHFMILILYIDIFSTKFDIRKNENIIIIIEVYLNNDTIKNDNI